MLSHAPEGVDRLPYFAVRVRSNFERKSELYLSAAGFETCLPTYRVRKQWSDRIKDVQVPLFPGYVFCRFDPTRLLPILSAPGVVQVVGIGKTPIPITEEEIASVKKTLSSGCFMTPWPYLRAGTRVTIEYGPLKGVEGVFVGFNKKHRIVLTISLLQRSVAAEIDPEWVRPCSKNWYVESESTVQPGMGKKG